MKLLRSASAVLAIWLASVIFADGDGVNAANTAKNLARMDCGRRIECILPNGQPAAIVSAGAAKNEPAVLVGEDDTISFPLPAGDTTFIISLAQASHPERLTIMNENAAARGELRIAVSNEKLAAQSASWNAAEGAVSFSNKRVFNVSLLGVEAKYVRLSFRVQDHDHTAAAAVDAERHRDDLAAIRLAERRDQQR